MFTKPSESSTPSSVAEGELYKVVTAFGKTFELRYGYYSDIDRDHPPDVIYPDFTVNTVYTEDGEPFVTMMQDACDGFTGKSGRTEDSTCAECIYMKRGEDWFGVCKCPRNRKNE